MKNRSGVLIPALIALVSNSALASSPLVEAAREGDLAIVESCLLSGFNVDEMDEDYFTPLLEAAENGHTVVVEFLLKKDAKADLAGRGNITPLIAAAKNGRTGVMRLLLDAKVDVNHCDLFGNTALIEAARNGHNEAVRMLLESGPDVDRFTDLGATALHFAASGGHEKSVELLLLYKANVNRPVRPGVYAGIAPPTPLSSAAMGGYFGIVRMISNAAQGRVDRRYYSNACSAAVGNKEMMNFLRNEWQKAKHK